MNIDTLDDALTELCDVSYCIQHMIVDSRWGELLRDGAFTSAVSHIERYLTEEPDNLEARLWWVRCHLELSDLPLHALLGQLEDLSAVKEHDNLSILAVSTLLVASLQLAQKSQSRLAVVMCERANVFAGGGDPQLVAAEPSLKRLYLHLLEVEYAAAQQRRDKRAYLSSLEEKLENAAVEVEKLPEPNVSQDSELPLEQISNPSPSADARPQSGMAVGKLLALFAVLFLGTGTVLLLLLFRVIPLPKVNSVDLELALAKEPVRVAQPLLPKISFSPRLSSLPENGSAALDSVNERLEKLSVAKRGESKNKGEVGTQKASIQLVTPDADYSSDADSNELEAISGLPSATDGFGRKLPALKSERFEKTKVSTVSTTRRRAPVNPRLKKDSKGRDYGPIRERDPVVRSGKKKALDGSTLKSYEVEEFDPPVVYRTIAPTEVMQKPSLLSKSLARLETNTPIQVVRRMGMWLELKSTGGHVGYIYAQDASKVAF